MHKNDPESYYCRVLDLTEDINLGQKMEILHALKFVIAAVQNLVTWIATSKQPEIIAKYGLKEKTNGLNQKIRHRRIFRANKKQGESRNQKPNFGTRSLYI